MFNEVHFLQSLDFDVNYFFLFSQILSIMLKLLLTNTQLCLITKTLYVCSFLIQAEQPSLLFISVIPKIRLFQSSQNLSIFLSLSLSIKITTAVLISAEPKEIAFLLQQ